MNNKIDFVKGHCGWDVLSLILAEQIAEGDEFETALKIVDSPVDGGIEVGILYPKKLQRCYTDKNIECS